MVSIVIIICLIRYVENCIIKKSFSFRLRVLTTKHARYSTPLYTSLYTHISDRAADDDIAMQACEPYDLHNIKISEVKEGVYEECKTSSDADRVYDEAIPSQ